jgi:hypothetical protein
MMPEATLQITTEDLYTDVTRYYGHWAATNEPSIIDIHSIKMAAFTMLNAST